MIIVKVSAEERICQGNSSISGYSFNKLHDLRFHFGASSERGGRGESGILRSQSVTSSDWGGRRGMIIPKIGIKSILSNVHGARCSCPSI